MNQAQSAKPKNGKRVLVLLYNNFTNDSRVLKECTTLVEEGYFVELWAAYDAKLPEYEVVQGIVVKRKFLKEGILITKIIHYFQHKSYLVTKFFKLLRYLRLYTRNYFSSFPKLPFDIIHCNDLLPLPLAVKIKKQNPGIKIIYDSHEYQTETSGVVNNPKKRKYIAHLEKKYIPCADAVITVSPSIAEIYTKMYNLKHVDVVKNCAALDETDYHSDYFRKKFNLSDQDIIFLFQGGLTAKVRGIEEILGCFEKLGIQGFANHHIVFMGSGMLEEKIRQKSQQSKNIHFHPIIRPDQIAEISSSADYGIIFYPNNCKNHYYCLPNKLFEYMTCGLPMIVSPLFDLKKMVEENNLGVITSDFDEKALFDAIVQISSRPEKALRDRIQNLHRTKYNWNIEKKTLLEIYRRLG